MGEEKRGVVSEVILDYAGEDVVGFGGRGTYRLDQRGAIVHGPNDSEIPIIHAIIDIQIVAPRKNKKKTTF